MPGLKIGKKQHGIQWDKLRIPVILGLIVALALFIRIYWAVGPAIQYGYAVSGGSDSYYHERIIDYILNSKHQMINDPMLNYPIGSINPRPPLFHWGIVMLGFLFAPFMGNNIYNAALLSLILFPAIWGSLTVIPVYLLGKEAFSKKAGLLAAFFLAIMPASITRSVATQADWDAFDLFFIVFSFYFFLRALKTVHYKYWIKDWFNKESVKNGLSEYFKENKESMIYAALSGVSIGALALAWKGYTYAIAILSIYLIVQVFINRFRNKSLLHIVMIMGIFILSAFGLAFPWYFITHTIKNWFDVPLILIGGVLLVGIILEVTGKYPWPLVFGISAIIIGAGLVLINIFLPDYWALIASGQGYFVKSKLYSTIAEAQPATLGYLAMSFGVAIFLLAFGGIIWILYLVKKEKEEYYLFFVFYSIIAVYMAISAARFIFNASPAFALTAAIGVIWLLDVLRFRESFEEYRKYQGSWKKKLKSAMKFSQVAFVLVLAFLLVVPTVWSAIDAGIPYETKKTYDKQIYNAMPSFMRPNETTYNKSSPWYLGAFGYSLPKPEYPWERAWKWLREQDNRTIPEDRPAFVSWWDYGFSAIRQGQHPAVADNFQNGYQMAAQIITAQNESEVISLFTIRLMEGDYKTHHDQFSQGMLNILYKYFSAEDVEKIRDAMKNPGKYRDVVLNNPDYYGYYEKDISDTNTKYAYLKGMFAHHSETFLISLYDDVRNYTGKDIRYFAIDYRLFPFSGRNTGIFYAPAKLGDRRIHEYGGTVVPYDFYTLKAVDQYGNEYDLDKVPGNVRIVDYKIEYKPMFYHSMLYKTFIGYSGQDVGASDGIPGISPSLYNYYPMQAWDMAHFKLVYRTAYWNPYKDYQNHTKDWKPIPIDLALKYQNENKGVVELNPPAYQVLPNDVVMVKFYEGAIVKGVVKLSNGEPARHVRVTLLDEYGIPHVSVFTDSNGRYRIPAVAGNLTLIVSTNGKLNKLKMIEQTILYSGKINVSEEQAMRLKPNYVIEKDITIKPANLDGIVYFDVNGDNRFDKGDVKINTGIFVLRNNTYGFNKTSPITNGMYSIKNIAPHTYTADVILNGRYFKGVENISLSSGQNLTKDIPITPSYITGNVTFVNGTPANNATVELKGIYAKYHVNTDENGSFKVMVVPDNYTVVASIGEFKSSNQIVIVNLWNYTTSVNLTLRHAFKLSGRATFEGIPAGHLTIKITSELLPHDIYIISTDGKGYFNIKIPGGIYTIYTTGYVNNKRIAYLNTINLNGNMNMNLHLKEAYKIYGYVHVDAKVKNPEVGIYGENTFYRAFANGTNYFEVYLPAGKYVIGSVGFTDNRTPYFGREIIHVSSNRYVDVTLHRAYNVTGTVYFDKNNNNKVDPGEIIDNGLVCLYDSQGIYEIRNIPPDGNFTMPTTIDYKIKTILWGYNQTSVSYGKFVKVKVAPSMTHVSGILSRGNMVNNIPVNIRFKSADNYTQEVYGVTSKYSVYLPPGNYTVSIFGYNRTYQIQTGKLVVHQGFAQQTFNITFKAYAHVMIVSQADHVSWFKNGRNITSGKVKDILIGKYTIYATNETSANMISVDIEENATIEVPLYPAYSVTFNIVNYSPDTPVNVRNGSAYITATGMVRLPAGYYNFTITKTKVENGNYYVYHALNETEIRSNTTVTLNVIKTNILTDLKGKLTGADEFGNCVIRFISLERYASNETAVTDATGNYEIHLTPGHYMMYTYFISGNNKYANISEVYVSGKEMHLNISMEKGYVISGATYLKGERVNTIIHISVEKATIDIPSYGYYWVILPKGEYRIRASVSRVEYGLNITYYFDEKINITGDMAYDIHLKRDTSHIIDAKVISADALVNPNGTMGITMRISNEGNIAENVSFEGVNGWEIKNKEKYTLYPGENKMVSLILQVPKSAKYGENSLQIRVVFSGLSQDITIHTNVTARYETYLKENMIGWDNNSLVYVVNIENKGNLRVNYTLSVLNGMELKDKGWNIVILVNGEKRNWVNLSAGQSYKVKIIATATTKNPSLVEPVELSAFDGKKDNVVKLQLYSPEIGHSSLYVVGENVHNYTGIEIEDYYYWVWGAAIALAVAILIVGRYRR